MTPNDSAVPGLPPGFRGSRTDIGREGDISRAGGTVAGLILGEEISPATTWWDRAACHGEDQAAFFPKYPNSFEAAQGKSICAGCPVQIDCALWAAEHPQLTPFGTWGGLTEWDRFPRRYRPKAKPVYARPVPVRADRVERAEKARRYSAEGMDTTHIAEMLRVSRRTIHRYLAAS